MNQENFTVGFWNYADCGVVGAKGSVGDWKELGMNAAMSFEYRGPADREYILELLDEAQRQGIKVIVCDCRVRWSNYSAKGSEGYKRDVERLSPISAATRLFWPFTLGTSRTLARGIPCLPRQSS